MTTPPQGDHRERLQNALLAIKKLQAKVAALESGRDEPIVVIGLACRFPGQATGPGAFWRLLRDGTDAVTEVPNSRFDIADHFDADPDTPGKSYSRWGGFIEGVDHFDPHFFGISPREAVGIDPQHRLLLETGWAALECAGVPPGALTGSRTGVFVGITGSDYAQLARAAGPEQLNAYSATGSTSAFVAGRLSYVLGLQGPSVAVDTACSSSLSAVHLACQSLRSRDCEMALVGGVSVMLTPDMFITTSRNRMLSPSGRCSTFDAAADGFVRGEGCGVVVLKRLSAALADGDPILALLRGSAMNQDGASSGMTVPNKLAQEAVIRDALAAAGVQPHEVQYVEAHGTGTSLGDPIELRALGAVLGEGRSPEAPFYVGSVKTNIGHLEAASGIAGLIKTVLILQQGEIPPHLHFQQPSPHIPWAEIPAVVPTSRIPWTAGETRRVAGVSSFGASGTNVHVVVEEFVGRGARGEGRGARSDGRPLQLLTLSARSEVDLRAQAVNFREHLAAAAAEALPDICHTAAVGRTHFAHRLAVAGAEPGEMVERLAAYLSGSDAPGLTAGEARPGVQPKVAFLFTGQGAQYVGMGRQLFETEPRFRETLEHCQEILRPHLKRPLLSVLYPAAGEEAEAQALLDQTAYTQPALFALEYALCELWRGWGIVPQALLGHSVGEYVAACVAGVFSLEEGLTLIAERARLMQALPAGGKMVAVRAEEALVAEAIAQYREAVSLAAVNGPRSVVISGAGGALDEIVAGLRVRGIECKPLSVSHAFHSPLLEPALDALEAAAARLSPQLPTLRLVSNLTGEVAGAELTHPGYWRRHARQPVRFARGMRTLEELGCDAFLEIGPHPVLLGMGQGCAADGAALWLPSLRRGREEWQEMLGSLARLHTVGAQVEWKEFDGGRGRRKVSIPTYPFQGGRYWIETPRRRSAPAASARSGGHPLLGAPLRAAARQRIFEAHIGAGEPAYLADHRVQGAVVLPAAAYLEMAVAAGETVLSGHVGELEDVVLHEPLLLEEDALRTVQLVLTPQPRGAAAFEIFSLQEDAATEEWRLHASGTLRLRAADAPDRADVSPSALAAALPDEVSAGVHYAELGARGLEFGDSFRGVLQVRRGESEAIAEVQLPGALAAEAAAYRMHPALLDACLQAVGAALATPATSYLPLSFDRIHLHGRLEGTLHSRATIRPAADAVETITADLQVYRDDGRVLLEVEGVALRPVRGDVLHSARAELDDWLYDVVWEPRPRVPAAAAPRSLDELLAPAAAHARALSDGDDAPLLEALWPRLDRLSAAYAARALSELGCRLTPGEDFTTDDLRARLGIVDRYQRMLGRLLDILAEDGVLAPEDGGWRVAREPSYPEPATLLAELRTRFPQSAGELGLLERCGTALAETLRGARDPLELLFPGGSLAETEHLYRDSPLTREFNALVGTAVASALDALPADRTLRVLEIGGGTGGTTAYVLPTLPAERTEYIFTDISPLFAERAKARFGAYPFVSARPLDIARDTGAQGFAPGSFDLIVAANVLHATPDLRATLRRVQGLLAPGGMLVLLEGLVKQRFADFTVGLTDGWWSFADRDLRSYALVGEEQWLTLLREAGLEPRAISGEGPFARQAVLVARAPAEAAPQTAPGSWLILADKGGVGAALAERLRARGEECVVVPLQTEERAALLPSPLAGEGPGEGGPLRGVIHLRALDDSPDTELTSAALDDAQRRVTGGALQLVQALAESGAAPRLWLVTRGAQAVAAGEPVSPLHAPLWGLGKVIALEHPELRCVRVDLDAEGREQEVDALFAELQTSGAEDQVALRGEDRYVARLVRRAPSSPAMLPLLGGQPYQLCSAGPRVLDSLELRALERREPGAGKVEVEVLATGLAFRDVLNALGRYPGPEVPLGGEFAGVVAAVGEGVAGLRAGDAVLGMTPGAFRSFVTTRAELVAPKPVGLSMAEAAALPSAFLTAHYALHHLAGVRTGDAVLIHAGAGGVGMAAIQIARQAGAELFATAGSPVKRAFLASLGVRHVFDSRSLDFANQVLDATGGRGVDVVLNSLADEFIPRSLEALTENGRFVELGKRGIWDAAQVASVRPGASYFVVDLGAAAVEEPTLIQTLLREMVTGFEEGVLRALPVKCFPMPEAVSAFRYMAQARQIGKIVLTHHPVPSVRADATYLITGGLGGVGLSTARWLVERGARHLVLVGRSAPSEAARQILAALEQAGAEVLTPQTDISRADQVDELLDTIRRGMPPLRGVFHSALVLDDGALVQQSWERFQRVFAPRVQGAWLLHTRTAHLPLDFFVLFSAAGAVLGSAGQANYSAANAFLDALAHHRRARGMPALSVQWGVWSEVGRAAAIGAEERLAAQGIGTMTPPQALAALETVMRQVHAPPQVAVMQVDWHRFLETAGASGASRFFARLASERRRSAAAASLAPISAPEPRRALRSELEEASPAKRASLLTTHVRRQVIKVLSLDSDHPLDALQPLQELGLDSLMAVELRTLLGSGLELPRGLPATLAFDYPTIEAITGYLVKEMFGLPAAPTNGASNGHGGAEAEALADMAELTDEEAEALLLAELDAMRSSKQ